MSFFLTSLGVALPKMPTTALDGPVQSAINFGKTFSHVIAVSCQSEFLNLLLALASKFSLCTSFVEVHAHLL